MSKPTLSACIVIVSTTAAAGESVDKTTDILKDVFAQKDGQCDWEVVQSIIVGDEFHAIQSKVCSLLDIFSPNLIVLSGGTGFAQSDVTPEAISGLLKKQAPGLVYGMLSASASITPFALMSRPVAGVINETIVITLPGSPKGAKENLQAVFRLLPHACLQAAGADSRELHKHGVKKLEAEAGVKTEAIVESPAPIPVVPARPKSRESKDRNHSCGHSHGSHGAGGHPKPVRHTSDSDIPKSNDPSAGPSNRHRSSPYPMLSVEDALAQIKEHTPTPTVVNAKVDINLVGAVLADDITATEAVPAFRASIVDGYAIIAPDDGSETSGTFPVVSVSHASPGEVKPLSAGQIARITTGAPLPPGANSVVMVEDTELIQTSNDGKEELYVKILAKDVKPGENIREVGSDIEQGSVILQKGDQISATGGELGLLVSVGKTEVPVYRRPVIGVLSTGDEIVDHTRPGELRYGEVRDCNRPTIMAAIKAWGYEVEDLGIASDTSGSLEETLRGALRRVDFIITSGGVSMGELDLLKPTIERQLGGTIHFGRVSMKPGKPTTFATVPFKDNTGLDVRKVIFALPGNPASAIVTLNLFVLAALHHASGIEPAGLPSVKVRLAHEVRLDTMRNEYHRAVVAVGKDGCLYAESTGKQRSSMVGSLKSANALLALPTGPGDRLEKGDEVTALLMGQLR